MGEEQISIYRRFIGVTTQGYFVVQDFYQENNQKQTDLYVLRSQDGIDDIGLWLNSALPPLFEGTFVGWYFNGQKWFEAHYHDGIEQGL